MRFSIINLGELLLMTGVIYIIEFGKQTKKMRDGGVRHVKIIKRAHEDYVKLLRKCKRTNHGIKVRRK